MSLPDTLLTATVCLLDSRVFNERIAQSEDQRAIAGELEEVIRFRTEYNAWQDAVNASIPDPTPESIFIHALPTNP